MKNVYCILAALILIVVSCSNRKQPSEYYPRSSSSYDSYTKPAKQDSVKHETTGQKPSSPVSSSGSKYKEQDLDNMRGFDPASEDDMDDNGMQRYFDANDDEAWD